MKQTPSAVRATIMSVDSLVFRLMLAAVGPLIGVFGDAYGLPPTFVGLGFSFGVVALILMIFWGGVWPKETG